MLARGRRMKAGYIAWILFGLLFAFSATGFLLSGNGSVYNFYNVGDVFEVVDTVYNMRDQQANGHQELSGQVILDNGEYVYAIWIEKNKDKWNYFYLDLEDVQAENLQAVLQFIKVENNGTWVAQEDRTGDLVEGSNCFEVPKNSFNYLCIYVRGEPGAAFFVKKMQLRETAAVFTWKAAIRIYAKALAIYCLIACGFLFVWKKLKLKCRLYRWVEVLQELYISVAGRLYESVSKVSWISRGRRCFRTLLFAAMFVYNVLVEIQGTYYDKFKYHLVFYVLMIILITVLTIGPELKRKNWNNTLVWSWLALWAMACASDFLVPKNYRFLGYAMVLAVGFFFFVWNNAENPHEITEDFVRAVHAFFCFVTVFCVCFRPETPGMRYSGFSKNPSIFSLYLGVIWAVILGEAEQGIRERKSVIRMIPYILESCIAVALCWKSQSAGPILCMLAVTFLWLLRMFWFAGKMKMRRKTVTAILLFVLLLVPVYGMTDWALNHVPQKLETMIVFENEQPMARRSWGIVAHAADIGEKFAGTRLGQKLASATVSDILSWRDYYYRTYLRNMNLFGHEKYPIMWGHRRLPHNAVLGIAYHYGIFAAVPYIMMLGAVLLRTFRHSRKNVKYAGMPFWICLLSILMSMGDNVEQPFVWLPWIALYLMMGSVFADEEQEDRDLVPQDAIEMGGNE